MNEDGTMARLDDLVTFARKHNMKIGTIRDLIAYRRQHDRMVKMTSEGIFPRNGDHKWKAMTFYNRATEEDDVALTYGRISPDKPTLVRMHTLSLFDDVLGKDSERKNLLSRAMDLIEDEGSGVVVIVNQIKNAKLGDIVKAHAGDTSVDNADEIRDYGGGAQVLTELGVNDMILLTDTSHTMVGLDGYGLSIVGQRGIAGD
jgi:3,4-dihydroxy 2-butanone 4-phosphate synthase/GTP cyclohydrolase II